MINKAIRLTNVAHEFGGAELGDERRADRLKIIAGLLDQEPAKSFPRVMGSDAALEALYRFLNNDGFDASEIGEPHVSQTGDRAKAVERAIAIHDTTFAEYRTQREDLGPTTAKSRFGFLAHAALLVDEEDGLPLGVGYHETLKRTGKKKQERRSKRAKSEDQDRETLRWIRGIDAIEELRNHQFEVIHVTDAEGDFFELIAHIKDLDGRFVIRAGQAARIVKAGDSLMSLREVADSIVTSTRREIQVTQRKHDKKRIPIARRLHYPDRNARIVQLSIGATKVVVSKPRYSTGSETSVEVNVVRVWEPKPPRGEEPIEWILITTEDCSSQQALQHIVDIYRKRWVIEEYFKALKSGCSLEKRQVESYDALRKVLALFIPIAYRMLLLRGLERIDAQQSAKHSFSSIDLLLLANAPANRRYQPPKTLSDAMIHLARLGGHIKNNGRPGWQTLAWGYEKLLTMRLGWEIAKAQKCDQS